MTTRAELCELLELPPIRQRHEALEKPWCHYCQMSAADMVVWSPDDPCPSRPKIPPPIGESAEEALRALYAFARKAPVADYDCAELLLTWGKLAGGQPTAALILTGLCANEDPEGDGADDDPARAFAKAVEAALLAAAEDGALGGGEDTARPHRRGADGVCVDCGQFFRKAEWADGETCPGGGE